MFSFDSLINFVSGLGTTKDPTTASQYGLNILGRNALENAYRGDWVARRIVDAPAEDATREWRSWQTEADQIELLEKAEQTFNIAEKVKQAKILSRLYGGAALVLGVDQGLPHEPLDIDKLGADCLKFVVVMHCYQLSAGELIYNVFSPWYLRPAYYTVQTPTYGFDLKAKDLDIKLGPGQLPAIGMGPGSAGVYLHPSRVIEFVGNKLPDVTLSPMGGNWGDSVLQTCDEALKDFGMTVGGIANMINDAKLDVVKIPDFSKNIATKQYAERLLTRFTLANQSKSMINTLLLDKEEEWERIQTNLSGMPNVMAEIMKVVAGAGGIPVSRLMGQSPGKGLSTTTGGDTDIKNYYDSIAAQQRTEDTPALEPLDRILMRSALGKEDDTIWYEWNPLYTPDPSQVATIALQKAQAAQADVTMALINPDALRRARVNQLIEDGTYPGLEDAIEKFGEEPPEPKPGDIDPKTGLPIPDPKDIDPITGLPKVDPLTGKPKLSGGGGGNAKPGNPFVKSGGDKSSGKPPTTLKIIHSVGDDGEELLDDDDFENWLNDGSPDQPRDQIGRWAKGPMSFRAFAVKQVPEAPQPFGPTGPTGDQTNAYIDRLKAAGRLNDDGTVSLYHLTLGDDDAVKNILEKGLIPNAQQSLGQQLWAAGHAAYGTYFFTEKEQALNQQEQSGGTTALIEARIPITPLTIMRFVPDEDESDQAIDGPEILVRGGALAFIGGVPAKALKLIKPATADGWTIDDYNPDERRDEHGKWTAGGARSGITTPAGQLTNAEIAKLTPQDIADRLEAAEAELRKITPTDKIDTPARQALRQYVVDTLYNHGIENRSHNRTATIVLGLPGSGKSTLAKPMLNSGAIEIEGDNAKALLPEFAGGVGAWAVHEEGSAIMRQVLAKAMANGDDIVWPRIDSKDKIVADVENLKKAGYTVHVKLVDTNAKEAAEAATVRFLKMGRYVSPEMILNYGNLSRESYEAAKATGIPASSEAYKRKASGAYGFDKTEG